MALKVTFPAIYERVTPIRTDEQVWADMNARFDSPAREVLRTPSTPLAPPPPDGEMPVKKTIGKQPERRKPEGRRAANARTPCQQHDWCNIGKAKTPGKVRRRCILCRREQTVPENQAPPRAYRKKAKEKSS